MIELSENNVLRFLREKKKKEYSITRLLRYFDTTAEALREFMRSTPKLARYIEKQGKRPRVAIKRSVSEETKAALLQLLADNSSKSYSYPDLSRRSKIPAKELKKLLDNLVSLGELRQAAEKNGVECYQAVPVTSVATARTFFPKREFKWALPSYLEERLDHHHIYTVPLDTDTDLRGIFA